MSYLSFRPRLTPYTPTPPRPIPQSELARAEATYICNTDNQYIVPTSGNPLRGLIQDHVASGVKLTCKNTFLCKADFQQLLYNAVHGLPGTEIVSTMENMVMPIPAISKPREMWTGKQVQFAMMVENAMMTMKISEIIILAKYVMLCSL